MLPLVSKFGTPSIGHPKYWISSTSQVLELNVLKDVKDKKKSIYKCTSGKRKNKENVVLLLKESGPLATKDWETG